MILNFNTVKWSPSASCFRRLAALSAVLCCCLAVSSVAAQQNKAEKKKAKKPKPLRALLVTGGCCHDYENQIEIIKQGLSQRANVKFEVFHGFSDRNRKVPLYQTTDWAKGYDVVVHNECYGAVADLKWVKNLVDGHTQHKVPLIAIHCAMHSYRAAKTDDWRQLLGVTSVRHERGGVSLDVVNRAPDHPITRNWAGQWKTPNGELYVIEKAWPNCKPLATAYGIGTKKDQTVIWVNEYKGTKVFGTTLGHHNETMLSDEWLDVVARGLLWSCGKLDEEGNIAAGYEGSGERKIWTPSMLRELAAQQKPTPAQPPVPTPAKPPVPTEKKKD